MILAIATETITNVDGLVSMPCYQWGASWWLYPMIMRCCVAKLLSLEEIAKYPLITYDTAFAGRSKIDHAFPSNALSPDVLFEAIDADVIKTMLSWAWA